MKEITRIHLAKVAYDIEVDAKKDVQQYITALERYAEDKETLDDIEIRITELLTERGVQAGGVIAKDDIAAVRAQLGEPHDFAPEGAGDITVGIDRINDSPRKLYRDTNAAILGGVLAGMARFFGIDALWVRLIFIVILMASFGTVLIVYLLLWLIVPAAKTAAEKLQMSGKPVTLEAIKALGDSDRDEASENAPAAVTRRVLRIATGIVVLIGAIGTLIATLFIGFGLSFGTSDNSPIASWRPTEAWWLTVGFGLFVLAGILLATLGFILANALLRRQWTKKIGTAVVIIITAGLLSFFSGVGTIWYGSWQDNVRLYDSRQVSKVNLPANFKNVTNLKIVSDDTRGEALYIEYIVSNTPRYELETFQGVKPQITISDDNNTATITMKDTTSQYHWGNFVQPSLKVYGPELQTITSENSTVHYYNDDHQQENITLLVASGSLSLSGSYKTVTATSKDVAEVALDGATIEELKSQVVDGRIKAGVVRTLDVEQSDVCAAHTDDTDQRRLVVSSVSSGKLTYNGTTQPAQSISQACGTVIIGDEEAYENRNDRD